MLFAALGKLDFITVIILMFAALVPQNFLWFAAIYLIIKGSVFGFGFQDFASKVDLVCGVYLLILSFGLNIPILHTLVLIWLFQKTALTFIAIGLKSFVLYQRYKTDLPFAQSY